MWNIKIENDPLSFFAPLSNKVKRCDKLGSSQRAQTYCAHGLMTQLRGRSTTQKQALDEVNQNLLALELNCGRNDLYEMNCSLWVVLRGAIRLSLRCSSEMKVHNWCSCGKTQERQCCLCNNWRHAVGKERGFGQRCVGDKRQFIKGKKLLCQSPIPCRNQTNWEGREGGRRLTRCRGRQAGGAIRLSPAHTPHFPRSCLITHTRRVSLTFVDHNHRDPINCKLPKWLTYVSARQLQTGQVALLWPCVQRAIRWFLFKDGDRQGFERGLWRDPTGSGTNR